DVVGSALPALERSGCVRPVDVAECPPVVASVPPLVGGLPPGLEGQAGAIAALTVGRRVARRVRRIRVDVVVVPAAPTPLVALVPCGVRGPRLREVALGRG